MHSSKHIHFLVQVMAVQQALLEFLRKEHPETMYPAALCALADLKEVLSFMMVLHDCCTTGLLLVPCSRRFSGCH